MADLGARPKPSAWRLEARVRACSLAARAYGPVSVGKALEAP